MSKRIKTKYTGVFFRETTTNSRTDKVFYIVYKHKGRTYEMKVGKFSDGIRANFANTVRMSTINSLTLGAELPHILINKQKKPITTFDELAKKYFDARELHNRTNHQARSKYRSQLQHFIGKRNAEQITKSDILSIQEDLAKTRAPKTVNQYIQFIRAVYNYAIQEELFFRKNPATGIKEQKVNNKRERYLAIDEIKLLLDAVQNDPDLYLFTLLSLSTGGRLNTIMHICKKDIDFEQNMITLHDIKNNDTYGGFFDQSIKKVLLRRTENLHENERVISMNERTLRRKMSRVLTALFNQELSADDRKNRTVVHTLRHTFASQLAISGTPIFTIQKLLNHKDIKQTLRYAKLEPNSGKDKIELFIKNLT